MPIGFIFGYFFTVPFLWMLTAICVAIFVYMALTYKEMEKAFTVLFTFCAIIANVTMWVTHYFVTGQTWFHLPLHHILR